MRIFALAALAAMLATPVYAQIQQQSINRSVQRGKFTIVTGQGLLHPSSCEVGPAPTFQNVSDPKLGKLRVETRTIPSSERNTAVFQCAGKQVPTLLVGYYAGSQPGTDKFQFYVTKAGYPILFTITIDVE